MDVVPEDAFERQALFFERAHLAERQAEAAADLKAKVAWQKIADGWRDLAQLQTTD